MNLTEHINNTLLKKRAKKLTESISALNDIRDKSFLHNKILETTTNLINEGYEMSEIINEMGDDNDIFGFEKNLMGAGGSMLKEYLINIFISTILGPSNKGIATTLSQVFADYNPIDILKPFKDMNSCNQYMPKMVDSFLEAFVRYMSSEALGGDRNNYGLNITGLASSFAGNLSGEVIKNTNIGETISDKFCKIIH